MLPTALQAKVLGLEVPDSLPLRGVRHLPHCQGISRIACVPALLTPLLPLLDNQNLKRGEQELAAYPL